MVSQSCEKGKQWRYEQEQFYLALVKLHIKLLNILSALGKPKGFPSSFSFFPFSSHCEASEENSKKNRKTRTQKYLEILPL